MSEEQFKKLKIGTRVRFKNSKEGGVLVADYGTQKIAVETYHLTNAIEWEFYDEKERKWKG